MQLARRPAEMSRDEVEAAFRAYWRRGAIDERWSDWALESFTEDVHYVERIYGVMRGKAAVHAWIMGVMKTNIHIRALLDWYTIDGARVVLGMTNRYEHPDGESASFDFAGLTILEYGGDGRFCYEEDWWDLPAAKRCHREFTEALAVHGPERLVEDEARRLARDPWG